ncbi:MAG: DUF3313 family protein [Xanthomonadales bacterium]|nr:DUF3313 family protein [Xanthomonadales bacterium]
MSARGWMRALLSVALVAPTVAPAATPALTKVPTLDQVSAEWANEGLTAVRVEGLDAVSVNPHARLDGYRKILVGEVEVKPWTDWRKRYFVPGSTRTLNLRPMVESATARVRDAIRREASGHGYSIVDEPAPDAIEVRISIVDIFLIAVKTAGRSERAEGLSLGNATLVAEIRDSTSRELVLRAFDLQQGPKPELPPGRAGEEAEAWLARAIDDWAELLRKGLDVSNRGAGAGG